MTEKEYLHEITMLLWFLLLEIAISTWILWSG